MSLSEAQQQELDALLHALCEESLDAAGEARLAEILAGSEEAQDLYIETLDLHASLAWNFGVGPRSAAKSATASVAAQAGTAERASPRPSTVRRHLDKWFRSGHGDASLGPWRWSVPALAGIVTFAAAILLLVMVFAAYGPWRPVANRDEAPVPGAQAEIDKSKAEVTDRKPEITPAARLTHLVDGRWANPATVMVPGSELCSGQTLELAAGEAEIAFRCGAIVWLRGRSVLQIESGKSARLLVGRVTARAETEQSHGFTLHTPTNSLVDMGTEFHVQTAADGHSEIHVTAGAIEIRSVKDKAEHRLAAGQTAQVEPGDAGIFAVIESGDRTPAFRFPTIESPSNRDYADASQHHATIRVAEGWLDFKSGPIELLLDGKGQTQPDSPHESAFFGNDVKGKILLDLGKTVRVKKINTYSWHRFQDVPPEHDRADSRATQRYNLYGTAADSPPPSQGDPAARGWTLISRVNTDDYFVVPPVKNRPAQQAVSIMGANGEVGRYRFLLWEVRPTHVSPHAQRGEERENTFFGEFDVYAE